MKGAISISQPESVLSLYLPFFIKMDLAPMEGPEQVPTELRFKPFIYSKQGRITEGQRVQLPRALRSKGAPRDDICLFQMK